MTLFNPGQGQLREIDAAVKPRSTDLWQSACTVCRMRLTFADERCQGGPPPPLHSSAILVPPVQDGGLGAHPVFSPKPPPEAAFLFHGPRDPNVAKSRAASNGGGYTCVITTLKTAAMRQGELS